MSLDVPAQGVRLVGRLDDVADRRAVPRGPPGTVAAADLAMRGFLDAADRFADPGRAPTSCHRRSTTAGRVTDPRPGWTCARSGSARCSCDGLRPHHPWLRLPIVGSDGRSSSCRGMTAAPGVYVVGQRFQHRRDSSFIDGARHDAQAGGATHHGLHGRHGRRHERADSGMSARYDVVVVGGRVAGASTALLLARAGARVALIERSRRAATPCQRMD